MLSHDIHQSKDNMPDNCINISMACAPLQSMAQTSIYLVHSNHGSSEKVQNNSPLSKTFCVAHYLVLKEIYG
jgi:hypothetical protein